MKLSLTESPRYRWHQFAIGSMLLLMLCCALFFGRVRFMVDEHNRQSRIVDEYRKSFGADSTWKPEAWWRPARVVGLSFESCKRKLDKDDLASIRELNYLERISFKQTLINDDCLSHLSGLPRLRRLNLSGTHITNDGLIHLTRLPKLEEVVLWDTAVTDDGALHLQELMPRTRVNHMATWAQVTQ